MFILKRFVKWIQWVRFLSSSTKLVDTHLIKVFWDFQPMDPASNFIFIPRNFNLTEDKSSTDSDYLIPSHTPGWVLKV
ncbi:hypothetical protein GIB67_032486 [Kingdonia uniflora]|uniref:Uncharacterized protein n=1 Tax=Kingdonia uniflora TaxID=39325 RepID=A0A7J7L7N5_9MAGN|nr:hypothetical protein GIB67_032486 [Kingdonia uniflora]